AARAALAAEDLPAARAIWAVLRRDFPDDAGVYAEETQALMRQRLFTEAEALQLEAQQRFPGAAGFCNDHAWAALFRGDHAAAADRWGAMRARFPDNADGY